jgi:opacity protein-like surface antigen
MKKLATVAALAILTASSVSAEGFYVGAGISQESLSPAGESFSFKSTNAIALIGYDINDMISVEAETSLPVSKDNINIVSEITGEFSAYHTAVFAKFTLPTSGSFKPFARAGMTKGSWKAEAIPSGEVVQKVNDTVFSYGIGAEWALSEKFGLRVDYSMMEMSNDVSPGDVEVIALSSVYRF